MQKNLAASLMPLVLLFGTALFLRIENSAEPLSTGRDDQEIARIMDAMTQEDPALKPELKKALLRYRTLDSEARKSVTLKRAWDSWQDPIVGQTIAARLKTLRQWKDFSLETPERRTSGQVTVILIHRNERLKAWFIPEAGEWKLSGLVVPYSSRLSH